MKKYMLYSEKEKLAKEYETWCDDIDLSLNNVKIARTNVVNVISFLLDKGYRKAIDIIDEFVEKVLRKIQYEYENYPNSMTVGTYYQLRKEINELATEMRQEVEK